VSLLIRLSFVVVSIFGALMGVNIRKPKGRSAKHKK
jgi:hypothetical protein